MKFKKWGIYGSIPEVNPRKLDRGTPISECKKKIFDLGDRVGYFGALGGCLWC